MEAKCFFKLGDMAMDAGSVIQCSIYENLGYLPWGVITFIDKMGLVEANYDFKEYTQIEVTIGTYEDNDKSEIVFKADVVSSSVRVSESSGSAHEIELKFLYRGENGNLLSLIPPAGYQDQTSMMVIKDICKTKKVKLRSHEHLLTQDSMSWLIVNHNLLTALNYLTDRSYVPDSVMMYGIQLNGDVSLYSVKDKFAEKSIATFMSCPPNYRNAAMNNGKFKTDAGPTIYFYNGKFTNDSGLGKESTTIELREMTTNPRKNRIEAKSTTLSPSTSTRDGGTNVIMYQASNSPQVHEKYTIAPAYRKAVISSYSISLELVSDNETFTKTGDVVNVVSGTFDANGAFSKSKLSSGKYLVLRKGYHFLRPIGGDAGFQTTIQLTTNSDGIGAS